MARAVALPEDVREEQHDRHDEEDGDEIDGQRPECGLCGDRMIQGVNAPVS
jgi:hypothetical protein